MAAPYAPPVKAEDWIARIGLSDLATPGSFKISPTLAAGDAKIAKDGGALNNLATLPAIDPAASAGVKVTLSGSASGEMDANLVCVQLIDQTSPKEWCDWAICIATVGGTYEKPTKAVAYRFYVALVDLAAAGSFKASPTIAAGDFQRDIDGAGFGNLTTLPSVAPAASIWVQIDLSSAEMNGDVVTLRCVDQTAVKEWADLIIAIQTVAAS